MKSKSLFALAGAIALGVVATAAVGAVPSRVALNQSVMPKGPAVQVLGPADGQRTVHFQVALAMRDVDALTQSNNAHEKLSHAALAERHFPTKENYKAVVAWLKSEGLTIEKTSSSRLGVRANGRVADVSRAFGVHFAHIKYQNEDLVASNDVPAIPANLAGIVLSITGLQPQSRAHTMHVIRPPSATKPPLYPKAFLSAYQATGLGNGGKTSTTAIVIDTFPYLSDVVQFWQTTGTPQRLANISLIQTVAAALPAPSGEESMDVETASSIAPNSKIRVYAATSLAFTDLDTAYLSLIDDMMSGIPVDEVSISLGLCENHTAKAEMKNEEQIYAAMTALGASIFVSSGDDGSDECKDGSVNPSWASTSANVTGVGGTLLKLNTDGSIKSEVAWTGSGGGISTITKLPKYQKPSSSTFRLCPDVAADADPNSGALVILNGQAQQIGGTSLAAPIWGGMMALINAQRHANGKHSLGLINPFIYPLNGTGNFRDITVGNNGHWAATAGYDVVTGLGTPVMSVLLPTLVAKP
jgi:kumamolisin